MPSCFICSKSASSANSRAALCSRGKDKSKTTSIGVGKPGTRGSSAQRQRQQQPGGRGHNAHAHANANTGKTSSGGNRNRNNGHSSIPSARSSSTSSVSSSPTASSIGAGAGGTRFEGAISREEVVSALAAQGQHVHAGGDGAEYEERRMNLGAKNTAAMKPGDRIIINTPGGGGWGPVGGESALARDADHTMAWRGGSHAAREEMALQA
ncbi:hypothetical protein EKO27_g2693 [Xylaria grammica]|uniref:Hydantoinase B/oxoprolinase domain-containing protein n=1 Tax=Xylaria grammica TaxID=363999 RepID=A0A439DDB4_9PEZI|nr:hypothetical protein EKO27_g2693 [Xylaria grammica]